ncbi:SH3 domain-containing protein [Anaerocolumna sp. MB42-C2]|uniref:SH3 domain-containing protein n=1 Tax=Anaerocolumna sp. MB42-C2 TaxID=3070997 RepID=UPI0027E0213A|nr:SH3 domain-containing protein [Anaerocolumna sp. MB42-C2]WMJ89633.1 SH3 domain-containing protein [Anaerocolumna sp. MB42-C2]
MRKSSIYKWIAIVLCLVLIYPGGITFNSLKALAATYGTVTATSLNIRSGPGTKYDKVQVNGSFAYLKKGDKFTIISKKDGWYKIAFTYSGKKTEGYVMDDFVKETNSTSATPTPTPTPTTGDTANQTPADLKLAASVMATNLNVRQKASTTSTKIASIVKRQKVNILNEVIVGKEKWYRISFQVNNKTKTGYVLSDFIGLSLSSGVKAAVSSKTKVKLRTGAGDSYKYLTTDKGTAIALSNKKAVTITKEVTDEKGKKWFKISFTLSGIKYSGYILGSQVLFTVNPVTPTPAVTPKPTTPPKPTTTPTPTQTPTPTTTPKPTVTPTPTDTTDIDTPDVLSDEEFEERLDEEGFPESYKPALRDLHESYPTWVFKAFQTGLDWDTVIEKESKLGVNLISNGKGVEWKSLEKGAYNWSTDSFIPFDGSTWVTPSKAGLEYYIDPRNFLDEKSIYQFELLTYQSEYQNVTGVEGILYNTPLYNCTYSYADDQGETLEHTYSETFMDAAEYSGVSPYHLASRAKQEVVTGTTTLSSSVSGTVGGLEGYYNFYNIGAYNSTAAGGAVANGLKYAKNGTTNQELNTLYLIPWDNPYNSIVGGAYIIGSNYIKRGQDTTYLQKFNVTGNSTYSHQYMSNIEAPNAESKKTFAAYSVMSEIPIAFSIPVYENMPDEPCPMPETVCNPNNWLKTLKVDGYSLTPTFDLTKEQEYSIIVEADIEEINVTATTVSKKASITGTGFIPLNEGNNEVIITVTAENGDVREYLINAVRE